jgi:hypothetical protein
MSTERTVEELADLEHRQWAHWMRYLFGQCEHHPDGSATIPPHLVACWQRQMDAPYAHLTEREKDSDREWARKVIEILDRK